MHITMRDTEGGTLHKPVIGVTNDSDQCDDALASQPWNLPHNA
jgi:hypothetical protein